MQERFVSRREGRVGMGQPGSGGRGPYRTGIKRREQIVAAAAKAFAEHGYNGASMRQIAAEVGVSPAALLRHFESKEELLSAVLEWWASETLAITREGQSGLAAFERLRDVMRYHTEHRGLLELFTRFTGEAVHPAHPARPFISLRYDTVVNNLVERLLAAAEAGEVPPLTRAKAEAEIRLLCSVMDGLEIQWLLDPGVDLVGLFDKYLTRTLERWKNGAYDG